jgi:hypothetical protein
MKNKALFLFVLAFYTFLWLPLAPVWAQSVKVPNSDLIAPVIQHEPADQPLAPDKQISLTATVTDNVAVKEAVLFYRTQGTDDYLSVNMEPKGKNLYTVIIPGPEVKEPGVEYYIQAADEAGNIALRGFSFSPLAVAVAPGAPGQKDEALTEKVFPSEDKETAFRTDDAGEKPWYKKGWVWGVIAGVVVIGAVAAGGGGGGGGGSSGPPAPSTGSATVSGPVP